MDRTTRLMKWTMVVTAVAFLAAGCSSAQPEETPATTTPARETVPESTQEEFPRSSVAETPSAPIAPPPTTTTEAPGARESGDDGVATPLPTESLDIDELDALLADLDRIFGDLDASLAQDKGDTFDD